MTVRALAMVALLIGIAGCADGGLPEGQGQDVAPLGSAQFGSRTSPSASPPSEIGALEGLVVDDEWFPISGAEITIVDSSFTMLTDSEGKFLVNGVPAASYRVVANATGYQIEEQIVDVAAGETARLEFVLPQVSVARGGVVQEVWHQAGFIECSWYVIGDSGGCGGFEKNYDPPLPNTSPFENPDSRWDWILKASSGEIIHEIIWEPTTSTTSQRLAVFLSYDARESTHFYCSAAGPSPLRLQYVRADVTPCKSGRAQTTSNPDDPDRIPAEGQTLRTFVTANTCTAIEAQCAAAVTIQQSFDIWFSVFYGGLAPPEYSAVPEQ